MIKKLFLTVVVAIVMISCSKTKNIETKQASLVGGWRSDSSVYQGYDGDRLVKQSTDKDDESELEAETIYFFEDGTFKYYYVNLEIPGKKDTVEIKPGNYFFNSATRELILEDITHRENCVVISLDEKKLVYRITVNNPQSPDLPDIDREITSFHLSRL